MLCVEGMAAVAAASILLVSREGKESVRRWPTKNGRSITERPCLAVWVRRAGFVRTYRLLNIVTNYSIRDWSEHGRQLTAKQPRPNDMRAALRALAGGAGPRISHQPYEMREGK